MQIARPASWFAGRKLSLPLLAIVLLLAFGAVILGAGWQARQQRLAQLEAPLLGRSASNAAILSRQLDELQRDVVFLAAVPPVSGIVRAGENGGHDARENTTIAAWNARLIQIFSAYAAAHPDIFQVRLIGMANHGRELIRVERNGAGIAVTPAAQLQDKGDTDYVKITRQLPPGAIHVSDFNLNREHGRVQAPSTPTVRVATPIYGNDGAVFGVLVLNYNLGTLMAELRANLPPYFTAYLTNGAGDFLLHPDQGRTFGFDLGQRWRWQDEFQAPPGDSGAADGVRRFTAPGGVVYAVRRSVVLDRLHRERDLQFVLTNSSAQVNAAGRSAQWNAVLALLSGTLLVGGAFYLYRGQRYLISEHQQRTLAIVENSHDAIIGKTLDGVVTSWNNGAQQMFGYSAQEACGRRLVELIMPAGSEPEEAEILRRIACGERIANVSSTRRRKDGSLLSVSVTSSPIKSANGIIIGAAATLRDISEQVAASRRIEELNAALEAQVSARTRQIESVTMLQRAILAHASYAVIATDPDGVVQLFNPSAERMLGYAAADIVGRQTPALWHDAAEVAARSALLSQELATPLAPGFEVFVAKARLGIADETEWTYIRNDGSRFPVLLSVTALRTEQGELSGFLGIASDISVREQERRMLVAARDQLFNAANVAELGIWTWTLEDNRLEWNERMCELYDLPPAERAQGLYYDHWRSRVHPDDVERVVAQLAAAVAGSAVYDPQFRVCHADGGIRYVQAAASVERDGSGRALRVLGINRDITHQHEVEQALRQATLAAESANRAKSEFLANMSHEIRSPMNAVLGMLTLLKQTRLDIAQLDYATKAEAAGRALLGILNDILDFSRVEAGKLTLDPQAFSIGQLLRDIAVILAANVGDKPLNILYRVEPDVPEWVVGDAMRLQQILINLAGNAVKFTEQGEVELAIYRVAPAPGQAAPDPDQLCLGFSVRDTGIGIAPEQCERIFDSFSQAEASTARRYGGSGLGLAICKRLIGLMDGVLAVDSTLGQGSTFRFHIPCRRGVPGRTCAAAAAGNTGANGARPLAGLRLLVVEDSATNQQVACELLRNEGATVVAANDGQAALAALGPDQTPFDCVLMDVQMPNMDGYTATRRIRADLGLRQLPVIAMTANAMHSDREAALASGMNDHIGKPFDLLHLVATILRNCNRPTAPAPARGQADAGAGLTRPGFNGVKALARFGGNVPLYLRTLRQFAAEAGPMVAATAAQGPGRSGAALHILKGVAATVGAEQLAELAARMEREMDDAGAAAAWPGLQWQLLAASQEAVVHAVQLADGLASALPAPAAMTAADPARLPAELLRLQRQLEAASTDALPLFEALAQDHGGRMPSGFAGLGCAIEQFDFPAAARLCASMLQELASQPSSRKL
jgi:two-component system sensor histidine kinase/response regulator